MKDQLPPEHQQRMEQTTYIILGSIALGVLIVLVVWSLPDWEWATDLTFTNILTYGGYGNAGA